MSEANDFRITEHLSLREFACGRGLCQHCGGVVKLYPKLAYALEALRLKTGYPLIVTSGYRCPKRNEEAGGVVNSFHTQGKAADVACRELTQKEIAEAALAIEELRVGYYRRGAAEIVHLDIAETNVGLPALWGNLAHTLGA